MKNWSGFCMHDTDCCQGMMSDLLDQSLRPIIPWHSLFMKLQESSTINRSVLAAGYRSAMLSSSLGKVSFLGQLDALATP
eukprot:3597902-Amphidinium_carterae.1